MADYVSNYTGEEIDGILEEAIELPQATSEDEGKVLMINSEGQPVWESQDIQSSLEYDLEGFADGKFLGTVGSTAHPGWVDISEMPIFPSYDNSYSSSDAGKVLTILDNGSLGWVLPNQ